MKHSFSKLKKTIKWFEQELEADDMDLETVVYSSYCHITPQDEFLAKIITITFVHYSMSSMPLYTIIMIVAVNTEIHWLRSKFPQRLKDKLLFALQILVVSKCSARVTLEVLEAFSS